MWDLFFLANILQKGDKMSAINLCVVGLANKFTDDLCNKLSIYLDMYYANVQKILDYELQVEDMEKICGKDYLLKKQKSVIKYKYRKEKVRPAIRDALYDVSIITICGEPPFLSMNTYYGG